MSELNRTFLAITTGVLGAMSLVAGGIAPQPSHQKSTRAQVENLHPYTHIANIPAGADLASIQLQGVKKVKVATQMRLTTDARDCANQQFRDPGGSMYCPYRRAESPAVAYRVTYSYRGQPMASDEYGNTYFTFNIYFRPEELDPAVREALDQHRMAKAEAAEYFALTTVRTPIRQVVIDDASSTFCAGNYIDGSWTRTDPKCKDVVNYKAITAPSEYITVRVDPSLSRQEEASSR